jgi:hypothetical protein
VHDAAKSHAVITHTLDLKPKIPATITVPTEDLAAVLDSLDAPDEVRVSVLPPTPPAKPTFATLSVAETISRSRGREVELTVWVNKVQQTPKGKLIGFDLDTVDLLTGEVTNSRLEHYAIADIQKVQIVGSLAEQAHRAAADLRLDGKLRELRIELMHDQPRQVQLRYILPASPWTLNYALVRSEKPDRWTIAARITIDNIAGAPWRRAELICERNQLLTMCQA